MRKSARSTYDVVSQVSEELLPALVAPLDLEEAVLQLWVHVHVIIGR